MNRWHKPLLYSILLLASLLCTGLIAARFIYTGQLHFTFLLWNLFLAWIPLLLADGVTCLRRHPPLAVGVAALWLLFLPNAPYLVTDLIHLRLYAGAPLWFDALMLFSFALTGLLLGFVSLAWVQRLVMARFGTLVGWLFALCALGLSGFGVYIGRFLRWNSWDLLTNPLAVAMDIAGTLTQPHLLLKTSLTTSLLGVMLCVAYVVMSALSHPVLDPIPIHYQRKATRINYE